MSIVERPVFGAPESGELPAGRLFDTPLSEARGWLIGADKEVILLPAEEAGQPGVLIVSEDGSSFHSELELDGAALPGGYVEPASRAVCRRLELEEGNERALALFITEREVADEGISPVTIHRPRNAMEASHAALRLTMLTDQDPTQR